MIVRAKLLKPGARVPQRASEGACGFDLFAADADTVEGVGAAGVGHSLIGTGVAVEIPDGFVGRIASRSGLSVQHNIEVGAGWIDSDYRGELKVELKNFGTQQFIVRPGDRIAQLLIIPIVIPDWVVSDNLGESHRGPRGFGSTGA